MMDCGQLKNIGKGINKSIGIIIMNKSDKERIVYNHIKIN